MTDEVVNHFMASRPLEWQGNPKVPRADLVVPISSEGDEGQVAKGDGEMTKSALKKQARLEKIAKEKAEKAAAKEAKEAKDKEAKEARAAEAS